MKSRIVLLGPPASGKGTQAEMITARYGIDATSPGSILRQEKEAGTELGREAASYTSRGLLAPDALVLAVIRAWLDRRDGGFIFDGFPRTIAQADALEKLLDARATSLDVVLSLEVPLEIIRERVQRRLICQNCRLIVSVGWQVAEADTPCPRCGGVLEHRADDTLETLEERMREFHEKSEPLVDYYAERGLLARIDSARAPEIVFADIREVLEAA